MDDPFDPPQKVELALLRAEYQKQYQVMIEYLKEKVGAGDEYRNNVVRVVVSENGAYYELLDLPEQFSGAVGEHVQRRFVAPAEAVALLTRAVEAIPRATRDNTRRLSLFVLYTRRGLIDRKNCYVYDYRPVESNPAHEPLVIGAFQPDVMPLFFSIKVLADFAPDVLEFGAGEAFCMANAGERHLLIGIPYLGEQVTDLSDLPATTTIH